MPTLSWFTCLPTSQHVPCASTRTFFIISVSFTSDWNQCGTAHPITLTNQWPNLTVIYPSGVQTRSDLIKKSKRRLRSWPLSLVTHLFIVRHGNSSSCQPHTLPFASSGTPRVKLGFLHNFLRLGGGGLWDWEIITCGVHFSSLSNGGGLRQSQLARGSFVFWPAQVARAKRDFCFFGGPKWLVTCSSRLTSRCQLACVPNFQMNC